LVKQVVPVYPQMARTARVEGAVTVDAIIQPSGKLTELKVVEGHPLLIDAALQALRQWRYKPAKLNGTAVESPVHINVVFRLVFPN
jgi:protein TonB